MTIQVPSDVIAVSSAGSSGLISPMRNSLINRRRGGLLSYPVASDQQILLAWARRRYRTPECEEACNHVKYKCILCKRDVHLLTGGSSRCVAPLSANEVSPDEQLKGGN